jgi:RecA/RadA recombinase
MYHFERLAFTQIEAALADRIPSALTPSPRILRPVTATGVPEIDAVLKGGFQLGAITEMAGPKSSGHTSVTFSFVAQMTKAGKVCAWVYVSNTLHPEPAAQRSCIYRGFFGCVVEC